MSVKEIVHYPDSILREPTNEVENFDDDLNALIKDMWDTMYAFDGIGLAAPQIGVPRKIIVIDYQGEKYTLVNPDIL